MSMKQRFSIVALFLGFLLAITACQSEEQKLQKQMHKDAKQLVELSCKARGRMLELLKEGKPEVNADSTYVRLRREQQQITADLNKKYGENPDQRKVFGDILKEERKNSATCNEVKEKYGLDEVAGENKKAE